MNKTLIIIIIIVFALVTAWHFYNKYKNSEKLRLSAESANVRLILDGVQRQNGGFSEAVEKELQNLLIRFEKTDKDITHQIAISIQQLSNGNKENTIAELVKILEHLLKKQYENDHSFQTWLNKRRSSLHRMIEYCKEQKKITEEEFQFYIGVKEIRNKIAHNLNYKIDEYLNASGLIIIIGAILKISGIELEAQIKKISV